MPSDTELIGRVRQRDAEAFDALLSRHGPAVRRRLLKILRDEEAAEDLQQEIFLRLWTRSEQWDGRGELAAWLGRIATNLAFNHLRTIRRRRQQPLQTPVADSDPDDDLPVPGWMIDASAVPPDEPAQMAEEQEWLARLIDALPEGKRQMVRMLSQGGTDMVKTAESLGIPQGTAKSRLHYAIKALSRAWRELEDHWENPR